MDTLTTQRILLSNAASSRHVRSAVHWAQRLPGMVRACFQKESSELVVTYDLRRATLADVRRHLQRGGVACDVSLIERFHLLTLHRVEMRRRAELGVPCLTLLMDAPLVQTQPVTKAA